MDKSLIIKELIKHYSEGKNIDFAKKLGIKPQTINTWVARNTFDIELIFAKCENINANWLLSGKGEMLRTQSDEQPRCAASEVSATEIELLRSAIRDKEERIEELKERIEDLKENQLLLRDRISFLEAEVAQYESASGVAAAAG